MKRAIKCAILALIISGFITIDIYHERLIENNPDICTYENHNPEGGESVNLLEHYIKEVHEVKPYTDEWTVKYDYPFVEVDVTVNCYGSIERKQGRIFSKPEWDQILEQGYFLS
jgi:hypothetical protein